MTAKGNLKKLPKLADDERYREALEALRQAETDARQGGERAGPSLWSDGLNEARGKERE